MITNITLENFKCFRHVSINPKLLTVLIGPNGTGKSSILQSLLLLKQSVGQEQLQFQGECLNLGGASAIAPNVSYQSAEFLFEIRGDISWGDERIQYHYSATFRSPAGTVRFAYGKLNTTFSVLSGNRSIEYPLEVVVDEYLSTPRIQLRALMSKPKTSKAIAVLSEFPDDSDWTGPQVPSGGEFALSQEIGQKLAERLQTPGFVLNHMCVVPAVRGMVRPRYPLGGHSC